MKISRLSSTFSENNPNAGTIPPMKAGLLTFTYGGDDVEKHSRHVIELYYNLLIRQKGINTPDEP